jgi:ABC-2 type transport system ATP-binding protein
MTTAIATRGLTKYYGKVRGIVDLDLEVKTGEVFGFLGPNGAGKSTTIRTLLHMLRPTAGSARVLDLDIVTDTVEIRRRTGYLPGDLSMYDAMTARQMTEYFAALRGVDCTQRVNELAERLKLDLDRKIGSYSTGNRQKAAIVQAFMHDPELLILDEPSTGLDPLMQQEFFELVDEAKAAGRTVFLSSHILPEVERLAERVGIVRNSELVAVESIESLRDKARRRIEIVFSEPVDPAAFLALGAVDTATSTHSGRGIELTVAGPLDSVMELASRSPIENIRSEEGDLEGAFLAYYAGSDVS